MVDALPRTSYAPVSVGEIACSTAVDEVYHHTTRNFPFPPQNCVPGLLEGDSGVFTLVANPVQTGFWDEEHSQQPWASTQLAQIAASPQIQCDSDRRPSSVDGNTNDLLSCPGIPNPLDAVPNLSDAIMEAAFTMTCPIPHCCFQCQTVVDMWKHLTWTHVRPNSKESGIENIVECVVLGGSS